MPQTKLLLLPLQIPLPSNFPHLSHWYHNSASCPNQKSGSHFFFLLELTFYLVHCHPPSPSPPLHIHSHSSAYCSHSSIVLYNFKQAWHSSSKNPPKPVNQRQNEIHFLSWLYIIQSLMPHMLASSSHTGLLSASQTPQDLSCFRASLLQLPLHRKYSSQSHRPSCVFPIKSSPHTGGRPWWSSG